MKKNNVSFNSIKARLSDEEINYQKVSDITFAVATEKDANNNLVGNGRNAGNRFESILRFFDSAALCIPWIAEILCTRTS